MVQTWSLIGAKKREEGNETNVRDRGKVKRQTTWGPDQDRTRVGERSNGRRVTGDDGRWEKGVQPGEHREGEKSLEGNIGHTVARQVKSDHLVGEKKTLRDNRRRSEKY